MGTMRECRKEGCNKLTSGLRCLEHSRNSKKGRNYSVSIMRKNWRKRNK